MKDFFDFIKEQKKWWMLPIFIMLLILGAIVIFASNSAVAPFIYTLF